MMPQIVDLAVQIVRFVDDYQPGIAACQFVDADGRRHTLIDKAPIFSAETLDADSRYPRLGTAQSVLKRRCDALRTGTSQYQHRRSLQYSVVRGGSGIRSATDSQLGTYARSLP